MRSTDIMVACECANTHEVRSTGIINRNWLTVYPELSGSYREGLERVRIVLVITGICVVPCLITLPEGWNLEAQVNVVISGWRDK